MERLKEMLKESSCGAQIFLVLSYDCEVSVCTGTTTLKSEPKGIYPSPSSITARSLLCTDDHTGLTRDCSTAGLNGGCYWLEVTRGYMDRVLY